MTTFNCNISSLERAVSLDGLSDVIQTVHWRYRGTNENGVTAETYGATSIGEPNPQDFTPWDEVTEEDVKGWLEAIMSVLPEVEEGVEPAIGSDTTQLEKMQENLESQIALLANPVTIIGPLATMMIIPGPAVTATTEEVVTEEVVEETATEETSEEA